jgi:PII-like signaling protein
MSKIIEDRVLMRIFIGENDRFGRIPLYKALVELFRREGCLSVTVLRGIAGYGADIRHSEKLIRLAHALPLVVEVVETQEKLDEVLPRLDEMMPGGMITLEKTTVIRYSRN